jgi:hypothetical protein
MRYPAAEKLEIIRRCVLRSGNVHSADGWRAVLEPVVARYRGTMKRLYWHRQLVGGLCVGTWHRNSSALSRRQHYVS